MENNKEKTFNEHKINFGKVLYELKVKTRGIRKRLTRVLYYKENKTRISNHVKKYYKDNKETLDLKHKIYYEENKDAITEYNKKYYHEHKQHLNELAKTYPYYTENVFCECGALILKCSKREHLKTKTHTDRMTNGKQNEDKVSCECGEFITKRKMSRHVKTEKHKQRLLKLNA